MQRRSTPRRPIFEKVLFCVRKSFHKFKCSKNGQKTACKFRRRPFSGTKKNFFKNRTTRCTPSLHALSNGKKKISKKHSLAYQKWDGKCVIFHQCFLYNSRKLVYFGLKFYRRLSTLSLIYSENFSSFGRSWAKIDFGGGGGP